MIEYLEQFEDLLDTVINNTNSDGVDEFKRKIIERLNEID